MIKTILRENIAGSTISIPNLLTAVVGANDPNILTLGFDMPVLITASGWSIATSGSSLSILSAVGSGGQYPSLLLSRDLDGSEIVTISYSGGSTTSITGGPLGALVSFSVTNNSQRSHTNDQGEELHAMFGDSIIHGTPFSAVGPTLSVGIATEWYNGVRANITNTDLPITNGAGSGSFAPHFASKYNTRTGLKPMFCNRAISGSSVALIASTTYDASKNDIIAGCTLLGVQRPAAIHICGGYNDAASAVTIASIQSGIVALIERLIEDFPGTPILVWQVNANNNQYYGRFGEVRKIWREMAEIYSNVHIVAQLAEFSDLLFYGDTNTHPNFNGYDQLATNIDSWFENDTFSKWARMLICNMLTAITTTRKNLIESFMTSALNDYLKLDSFFLFKNSSLNNTLVDLGLMGGTSNFLASPMNYYPNDGIETNNFNLTRLLGYAQLHASQNDSFQLIKLTGNAVPTSNGKDSYLFGGVRQGTTQLKYRANDSTDTNYLGETPFVAGNWYGSARIGSTKYLLKNSVELQSAVVTSTEQIQSAWLGSDYAGGNFSWNGNVYPTSFSAFIAGKYSTTDLTNLIPALNTLLSNW